MLLALAWPLGRWIARVMEGRFAFGNKVEAPLYRVAGVKADAEMGWLQYAIAILIFNLIGRSSSMRCSGCRRGCR